MPGVDPLRRSDALRRVAIACAFVPLSLVVISFAVAFLLYGPLAREPHYLASPETDPVALQRAVNHRLGLDESWYRHGFEWPIDAVRGDLGRSAMTGGDVRHLVVHSAPQSVELLLLTVAIGTLVAFIIAWLVGHSSRRVSRQAVIVCAALFASVPGFVALVLLILIPSEYFSYAAPVERTRLAEDVWNNLRLFCPITIVVGTIGGAATWRTIASAPWKARQVAGLALSQVPLTMSGVVVAESIFGIDGVGHLLFVSTRWQDLPIVQSVAVLILFPATLAYALRRALVGRAIPAQRISGSVNWRSPLAMAALTGIALFVAVGVLAPLIEPYDPTAISFELRSASPSLHHVFGATKFGQDELSRVIEGTRTSLRFSAVILALGLLPGMALGLAAERTPSQLRRAFHAIADGIVSLPGFVLIVVFVAARGPGLDVVAIPIAFTAFAIGVRAVDGHSARDATLISPRSRIVRFAPALLEAVMLAVLAEATASFFGFGVTIPGVSWGGDIADVRFFDRYYAFLYGPAAALYVALLSCALAVIVCSQPFDAEEPGQAQEPDGVVEK